MSQDPQPDTQTSQSTLLTQPTQEPLQVGSQAAWFHCLELFSQASGPVAIDVERAQSFRYSDKAYLVQLRRSGAGTALIDPLAFETAPDQVADFAPLQKMLGDAEWIVHAATQDLPNLRALNMKPPALFDTELAGRLLGLPKVGLGTMIEQFLGFRLLKEHSAADWSQRPIPADLVAYAALDVELLIELRDVLARELASAGKTEWAHQEFAHLLNFDHHKRRPDRWRRTSGTHQVRSPRGMALVRELWLTRDRIAHDLDRAPGKVLNDQAITALAAKINSRHPAVPTLAELRSVEGFRRREARKHMASWEQALQTVAELDSSQLPPLRVAHEGPPNPRNWEHLRPEADRRWTVGRQAVVELAGELNVPVENLISPTALRELLWEPRGLAADDLQAQLAELDVRPWQRELVVPVLVAHLG